MSRCRKGAEAGSDAVKRQANRGRIAERWSGAAQANHSSTWALRPRGRTGKDLRGRCGESRVLGNRAMLGCSCRNSVAEVGEKHLPRAPTRRAARQTEGARGSTDPRLVPGRGRVDGSCERVRGACRERHRDRQHSSLDRKVENQADGRRPGPTPGSISNEVVASGILAS